MRTLNLCTGLATLFSVLLVTFLLLATPAFAETRIAVVNVQILLSKSKAAKNIQLQLEKKQGLFQKELSSHEENLKKQEVAFKKGRSELSQEEFLKQRQALERDFMEGQRMVRRKRLVLDGAAGEALNSLRKEIFNVVAELADKNGYEIVVTQQNVILAKPELDITKDVMAVLDKKIPEIKINFKGN